jgi:hypothetical protein
MKMRSKLPLLAFLGVSLLASAAHALDARSVVGKTYRTWSPQHGSQIEYIGPRGLWGFLWYPGNRVVVPSRWEPRMVDGVPTVCQLWPARSYNPATGKVGGWECVPERIWAAKIVEVARGDIFGLAHNPGTPYPTPFPLPREPLSFSELRQMMGRAGTRRQMRAEVEAPRASTPEAEFVHLTIGMATPPLMP